MNRPAARRLRPAARRREEIEMHRLNGLGKRTIAAALVGASLWSVSGCGGGASVAPSVTLKKSVDNAPAGDGGGSGGEATPTTDNGGAAPAAGVVGTLIGKVVFDGTPPSLPPLVAQGDRAAKD